MTLSQALWELDDEGGLREITENQIVGRELKALGVNSIVSDPDEDAYFIPDEEDEAESEVPDK